MRGDSAAASSRSRRGRALRREGPPSARVDSDRRHAHHAARAIVPRSVAAGHRSVGAPVAEGLSGEVDRDAAGARPSSRSPARAWSACTASPRARSRRSIGRRACRCRRSSRRRPRARSASPCRSRKPIARCVPAAGLPPRNRAAAGSTASARAANMTVIAVVGDGMAGTPGISARVFARARKRRHQRRGDRAGIVRAQHFVRGRRRRMPPKRRAGCMRPFSCRRSAAAGQSPGRTPTWCCWDSAASAARSPIRSRTSRSRDVRDRRAARSLRLCLRRARHSRRAAAPTGAREGSRRAAGLARRARGLGAGCAVVHGGARGVAAGRRRRHQRRDGGRCSGPRDRSRVRHRAGEQEAAGGSRDDYEHLVTACLTAGRQRALRSDRRRRASDDRHVQQARRDRRSRAADRRLRQRHADVRAVGSLGGPAVLGGGAATPWRAATPSPIRATTSRAAMRPARA